MVVKSRYWIAVGFSLTLTACGGGGSDSGSAPPTRFLSVQPIQVCDDFGLICAELALFEEATRKLWAQANVVIDFLTPNRLNDSRFLTIDDQQEFSELSFGGGSGAFGRHPLSTRTTGPLNLWFVDRIFAYDNDTETLGLGWIDLNGVVVSDNLLGFNNGLDRIDTVGHEIGHNLGLTHGNFGAGGANNLMTDGLSRRSPLSIAEITPDGANLGQLTQAQIDFVRQSPLLGDQPNQFPASGAVGPPTTTPAFLDAAPDAVALTLPPVPDSQPAPPELSLEPRTGNVVGADTPGYAAAVPWFRPPEATSDTRSQVAGEPWTAGTLGGDSVTFQEPLGLSPQPWLPDLPQEPEITIPEPDPLVQLVARADLPPVRPTPTPQPVPNGPAISLLSALLLGGYFWRNRRQGRRG
ncbi:MAG: zinc-dependent metalloprotease family protein [Spirulina sp.]